MKGCGFGGESFSFPSIGNIYVAKNCSENFILFIFDPLFLLNYYLELIYLKIFALLPPKEMRFFHQNAKIKKIQELL